MNAWTRAAFFPYVVATGENDGTIFGLGHGLGVVLLGEHAGGRRLLRREELEALGLDPFATYLRMRERLHALFRSGLLPADLLVGPTGERCLVFHHLWLAASCMLLPGLHEIASRALGTDELRIAVPRHDRLVVFRAGDAEETRATAAWAASGAVELTSEVFVLDVAGTSPLYPSHVRARFRGPSRSEPSIEIDLDDILVTGSEHAA